MKTYSAVAQHFILDERYIEARTFLGIIPLWWANQKVVPKAGVSQEIFRNGTYFLSVGPNFKAELPKLQKGDDIYSISLLPRSYSFDGSIITKECKQQGYDLHFEMRVVNATRFMEMYHNTQDPAKWIFIQFKQAFEYYAARMGDVTEARILPWLEKQITLYSQQCGLQIMRPVWFLHTLNADQNNATKNEDIWQVAERKKRELDLEYDLKLYEERLKRDLEREQKEFNRQEKARQNDLARSEKKKTYVLDEQKKLLSSTVNGLIQINNDRVSDSIGYNSPAQEILRDSLRLLASLNNSLENTSQEADTIAGTIPSDATISADTEDDSPDIEMYPTTPSIVGTGDDERRKEITHGEISSSPERDTFGRTP